MEYIKIALQIAPIILAILAVLRCAERLSMDRRKGSRRVLLLAMISSLLLIIAQISWFVTNTVQGNLLGTWFANTVWDIFNNLTMLTFILLTNWRNHNVAKPSSTGD